MQNAGTGNRRGLPVQHLLYLYPHVLSGFVVAALLAAGPWPFAILAWLYVGSILVDRLFGNRFEGADAVNGRSSPYFDLLLYAAVPLQTAILAIGLWQIAFNPLRWWEIVGITLVMGASGGALGIVAAHELIHRQGRWARGLGVFLLLFAHIPHFRIEHVHNHHRKVATPEDPASADIGDTVWAFAGRSMIGQYRSAWATESARMIRRSLAPFGWRNRMIQYLAMQALLLAAVTAVFGWPGLLAFAVQGLLAAFALEVINYIEHYGLRRRETAPGRYEPVQHHHSWSTAAVTTDYGLFGLGRHAAHHVDGSIPYPDLVNDEGMPQLPTGYAGSYMLALFPPLWRRAMDGRARAVRAHFVGRHPDAAPEDLRSAPAPHQA